MQLAHQTIIITGASSGIGEAAPPGCLLKKAPI